MAVRYSGDTEVRVVWDARKGVYVGSVRDPRGTWRGDVPAGFFTRDPKSSSAYDGAAKRMIVLAERAARRWGKSFDVERKRGVIQISRTFQAPCPCDDPRPRRRS